MESHRHILFFDGPAAFRHRSAKGRGDPFAEFERCAAADAVGWHDRSDRQAVPGAGTGTDTAPTHAFSASAGAGGHATAAHRLPGQRGFRCRSYLPG